MKRAVLSLSGGMDSTCLLVNLLANGYSEIQAIGFNYGQRHKVELEKAQKNIEYLQDQGFNVKYQIVDLTTVGVLLDSALTNTKEVPEGHYENEEMKDTVVPNRNIMFSSIVYAVALSLSSKGNNEVAIALGMHNGDNAVYPDCRPESVQAARHAFEISNWGSENVKYLAPYLETNKEGILRQCLVDCDFLDLEFDTVLKNTSTTYKPTKEGKSEGKSSSDIERIEAFININREDPAEYTKPWEEIVAHAKQVLEK